jgi:hypothetical protein
MSGAEASAVLRHVFISMYYTVTPSGGPGSSVGIATDYGLDGPGIES